MLMHNTNLFNDAQLNQPAKPALKVIYQPTGKAREYSTFACNLFTGCTHRCLYCYAPKILQKSLDDWAANPQPKNNILTLLEKDLRGFGHYYPNEDLLFCFMSDPYQTPQASQLTHQALSLCQKAGLKNVNVLTKNPQAALDWSAGMLASNRWKLAATVCFDDDTLRQTYEPGAPTIQSRIEAIRKAHKEGIYVWISVEPIICPNAAIRLIRQLIDVVDFWKIGKLNHMPEIECKIDWRKTVHQIIDIFKYYNKTNYYIKQDLRKFL